MRIIHKAFIRIHYIHKYLNLIAPQHPNGFEPETLPGFCWLPEPLLVVHTKKHRTEVQSMGMDMEILTGTHIHEKRRGHQGLCPRQFFGFSAKF